LTHCAPVGNFVGVAVVQVAVEGAVDARGAEEKVTINSNIVTKTILQINVFSSKIKEIK
jgi:hypothetical protein